MIYRSVRHRLFFKNREGVISLVATLLLGGIIIEIGLVGALLAYLLNSGNYGARLSAEALIAAKSGVDDGLLRIIRRDDNLVGAPTYAYSITTSTVGGATVTLCRQSASCPDLSTQERQIVSVGSALSKKRKMIAVVILDATTSRMSIESLQELP